MYIMWVVKVEGDVLQSTQTDDNDQLQRHSIHMAKESILQAKQLSRHVSNSMQQLETSMEQLGRSDKASELRSANDRTYKNTKR